MSYFSLFWSTMVGVGLVTLWAWVCWLISGFDLRTWSLIFLGSWVWLIFWESFHLLFCRTWRIVLGSPALFWVCICSGFALDSGFYFLFFWIWWRLDLVVGFGFRFARDWIGCWVYFLNLGRTWSIGWYVLTEKNNESKNNNNNRFKAKNNNNMKVKI